MAILSKYVSGVFLHATNCCRTLSTDKSSFRALYFSVVPEEHKEPTVYKLICAGPEERVVGIHILGMGSDEVMQGFGVAVKMGGGHSFFFFFGSSRHHVSSS